MMAVTFVLLLIFMSGRFIKYLSQAAAGGVSPDIILSIMLYRLPGFLELILPLGFFIGILLAYGRMYLDSEMTVLNACGYSQKQLLKTTLLLSFFVSVIVGFMSLYLSPWGMKNVGLLFDEQEKKTEFEILAPGRFQSFHSGDNVTYIESISEDKQTMRSVFISKKTDEGGALELIFADEGSQKINDNGDRFLILTRGTRYFGKPGDFNYQQITFDSYGIKIEERDVEQHKLKREARPSSVLWDSKNSKSKALLQWRISIPLLVPIVALLAVSVSRVNPRQGRFVHLFPAMLVYVAYLGLLIVARKSLGKGEIPEWLGLWGVHVVFLLLSLALLSKDKWVGLISRKSKKISSNYA